MHGGLERAQIMHGACTDYAWGMHRAHGARMERAWPTAGSGGGVGKILIEKKFENNKENK